MSSRRRSGQPRSPLGTRSAKVAPPPAAPSMLTPGPTPSEPASEVQDGPSVADALLSSVSMGAVDVVREPSLAAPLRLSDDAASADAVEPASPPAAAAPGAEVSGADAPVDGPAGSEAAAAGPGTIEAAEDPAPDADADAIVVPVPSARGPARTGRPIALVSSSFAPLSEINATLTDFVRGEGAAAIAHLGALTRATSPAEAIRLQVGEFQRAADASLTCFSAIVRSAHRLAEAGRAS